MKKFIDGLARELQKTAPLFLVMIFVCIEVGKHKNSTPDIDSIFAFVEGIVGGWILIGLIGAITKK